MSLQGMSLQGMSLQGRSLLGMSLQGTTLVGLLKNDVLQTTDLTGSPTTLRIADVRTDWQDTSGEIKLYAVEARDAATGQWQNVCGADPWGERWAIPISGSWDATGKHVDDPNVFTFGCTSGVIAKCVRWGYKPWKTVDGASLAPYHQACTRMARADYCGDGTPHTQNGTMIDMYDIMGIQKSESGADFLFEAAWTPEGAYCISKERWSGMMLQTAASEPDQKCAAKFDRLTTATVSTNDICLVKLNQGKKGDIVLYNRSRFNVLPGQ
jgi:uncharacterized protein YjbI with pentapeptide repeats